MPGRTEAASCCPGRRCWDSAAGDGRLRRSAGTVPSRSKPAGASVRLPTVLSWSGSARPTCGCARTVRNPAPGRLCARRCDSTAAVSACIGTIGTPVLSIRTIRSISPRRRDLPRLSPKRSASGRALRPTSTGGCGILRPTVTGRCTVRRLRAARPTVRSIRRCTVPKCPIR